ncbi:RNA polymerase sigma factor [Cytobacillus purgationiresistens]|uniref:RNA polymerase sigma-70 factor (ECF subfamily) n=1 Tax=Cytobacillus purgationiresistens TaxID=863449 RepID=A0ABU0AJM4_9BACI|nr:RNA polymerase sigma factor [Cytobacillus purgationiresistens]MDQ0271467.1 RNA polymerase sigma-70 factor (ECF subfamily) [Cytobacillus purgationiresistens]
MEKDKRQLVMEWYDLYYDDIYRFILFMLGDQQVCEDFVHDTFVRAYAAVEGFDNRSSVKTWLFSIAKHIVLDEIRKRKRRSLFSFTNGVKEIPSLFNMEEWLENREEVRQLLTEIEKLRPNYRMVVILKNIDECSSKEMAEILNWSEAKVRKTLSRAMKSLKESRDRKGGRQIEQIT